MFRKVSLSLVAISCIFILLHIIYTYRPLRREAATVLSAADTLVWTRPDSTLQLLGRLPYESLSASDRALYGLLMTQSVLRSGQSLSDTHLIERSIHYYERHPSPIDRLVLSLFYAGDHYLCQRQPDKALPYLKRAEQILSTAPSGYGAMLVYSSLGQLYRDYGQYTLSLTHYLQSEAAALKLSDPTSLHQVRCAMLTLPPAQKDTLLSRRLVRSLLCNLSVMPLRTRAYVYNNIGWYYEHQNQPDSALKHYDLSIRYAPVDYYVPRVNRIRLLSRCGHLTDTDTLLLPPSTPPLLQNFTRSLLYYERGDYSLSAQNALSFARGVPRFYDSLHQTHLIELQNRYDQEMQRHLYQHDVDYLRTCTLVSLLFFTVFFLVYRYLSQQKRKRTRQELFALTRQLDDCRHQLTCSPTPQELSALRHQISTLSDRLSLMDKETSRWKAIYHTQTLSGHLNVEDITALSVYIDLRHQLRPFFASHDHVPLEHWLTLTDPCFVERLFLTHNNLSQTEYDTIYFMRLGLSYHEIASLYQVRPIAIMQRVYRICQKSGLSSDARHFQHYILTL